MSHLEVLMGGLATVRLNKGVSLALSEKTYGWTVKQGEPTTVSKHETRASTFSRTMGNKTIIIRRLTT